MHFCLVHWNRNSNFCSILPTKFVLHLKKSACTHVVSIRMYRRWQIRVCVWKSELLSMAIIFYPNADRSRPDYNLQQWHITWCPLFVWFTMIIVVADSYGKMDFFLSLSTAVSSNSSRAPNFWLLISCPSGKTLEMGWKIKIFGLFLKSCAFYWTKLEYFFGTFCSVFLKKN